MGQVNNSGEAIDAVSVAVRARLHLGFLDLNGGLGRRFGSLGMALDRPETRLRLSRAAITRVRGPESERAARHLAAMTDALRLAGGHDLLVEEAIPAHHGLGSGTQIGLAVAAALRTLHGLELDPRGDAALLGRGERSGIGVGLFDAGGVVLDGGRGGRDELPPIISRLPFPEAWRVLLILDPNRVGVHGSAEAEAFTALLEFPPEDAAHLCRLVLMRALPALAERDLTGFGRAITEIQARVGDHFAPAQGGRFTSAGVAAALGRLTGAGVAGIGQSSWGPTGFAFAASEEDAQRLKSLVAGEAGRFGLDLRIASGRNRGATVKARAARRELEVRYG